MMTLYDYAMAPNPRRARIFLAEKGLSYTKINVDLRAKEQFSPEFMAINPLSTVPVLLSEEGDVLPDNAAIAAYIEALYPQPCLLGSRPQDKALIATWNWRAEFEGLMAVAEALRNSAPSMADRALPGPHAFAQIPALAERGRQRIAIFFDTLNTRLAASTYLAGEQLSIADITALVSVDFAKVVACTPLPEQVHLQRWRELLQSRPAFSA